MAEISPGNYLQAGSYTAAMDRRMLLSLFDGRAGVIPRTATFTDLKVSQRGAGANMSVDVAEGSCVVLGTEATYQGAYYCEEQGVLNVVITAANATNPRRDLIVARIRDAEYSGATNTFAIEVTTGTAAASPADPTVPANCVVLARVAVAANATSITNANITDLRAGYAAVTGSAVIGNQIKVAAPGGVVVCTSSFRPTTGLYAGLVIYETDTNLMYIYSGSAWTTTRCAGRVYAAAGAFINALGAPVALVFDSTSFVRGGMTAGSSGLTVPVTGIYQVNGHVKMQPPLAGATGFSPAILKNGTLAAYGDQLDTSANYQARMVADCLSFSAGDVIGLGYFWAGAGTALQADGVGASNYLSATLVGP